MKIHSRRSWGARKPVNRAYHNPRGHKALFVHWNGTSPVSFKHINTVAEERELMRSTQAFHMGPERKWSDFAYSYAIMPSGRIYRGRGITRVPASQLNNNTNTVSVIVFLGPGDTVTPAVKKSIRDLHRYVNRRSRLRVRLRPHSAVTQTECPGPKLTAVVKEMT